MHSPEPWTWNIDTMISDSGDVFSTAQDYELSPSQEDADRIVACVNACEGIPTEDLVDERVSVKVDLARIPGSPPNYIVAFNEDDVPHFVKYLIGKMTREHVNEVVCHLHERKMMETP